MSFTNVHQEEAAMALMTIAKRSAFLVLLSGACASAQLHVTVNPSLPSLNGDDKAQDADSDDNVYCRPPQPLGDSRLLGPKICMTTKKWNDLHASGYDLDARGVVKPRQGLDDLKVLGH
jgi:hypothetical protein